MNTAEDKLQIVLNRLETAQEFTLDTETSGLDWRRNFVVGYVYTFGPSPGDSYYLPFRHRPGGNIGGQPGPREATGWDGKLHPAEIELRKRSDVQGKRLVGHHLNFDLKMLYPLGWQFRTRMEDTVINAPLIDEFQERFSLDFCCKVAGVQAKKGEQLYDHIIATVPEAAGAKGSKAMEWYWHLSGDDPIGVEYAEGDGTSTIQLRDWQRPRLAEQELERVWDIECRLIPVLARMQCRGIKIDEARLEWLIDHITRRVEELKNGFWSGFNERSSTDVRKWCELNGRLDWPYTQPTTRFPKGQPSFTEDWLETFEAGQKIIEVRKLSNLMNSFVRPMADHHMFRGRVHTTYNQLRGDEFGTITGRLSSSDPNLQQVPKHDEKLGRLFRSIFVPDDGMIWGSDDYSQCEPVLLAFYSRCKVLVDGFNANPPVDAHTAVSAAMNPDWENMDAKARKQYRNDYGKRINQTLVTGGGKGVLVRKYKVDPKLVDEAWNRYFDAMPEIKVLQNRSSKVMSQRGYVKSLLGRRARLQDPGRSYVATNRLLQCGNADILKTKMVEIDDYLEAEGRPLDLLNNVHDAFDSQFPEEARKHREEVLRIMQDFGPGQLIHLDNVPLRVDPGEGRSWAEATYGEEKK